MMPGTLYAIPSPLGGKAADALPVSALSIIRTLRFFSVENARSARAFLGDVGMPCPIQELEISVLDKDFSREIGTLKHGDSLGLLSEAGCPAIADPGASLIEIAHRENIRVVPLIGPSSIVLALMASGLEGQRFAFCGYLPREAEARKKRIKELEARSRKERETQIFIETPYRNDAMLASLLEVLAPRTLLCVASDLTLKTEEVKTKPVGQWRAAHHAIGKRPTVFLFASE
ncbi:MAG: SAM-dependent methyltransferase [Pseudomonadota bacterium]